MPSTLRALLCGLIFISAPVHSVHAADTAEAEYQSLKQLFDRQSRGDERGSDADFEWILERSRTLRERGLSFIANHPTHSLRWDVLVLLQHSGRLEISVRSDGSRYAAMPRAEREAWQRTYFGRIEDLLESTDAGAAARHEALIQLIDHYCMEIRRAVVDNPRKGLVPALLEWVNEFYALDPRSNKLGYLYTRVARMLNAIAPAQCRAFLEEKRALHSGNDRESVHVRRLIENFQRLMRNQDQPADELWEHLQRIEPTLTDLSPYRGKVVLIAWLAVDWTSGTRELEELYEKFHDAGLEIIQIAYQNRGQTVTQVGNERRLTPAPLLQRDRAAMERFVAEKKWPWRVLWDTSYFDQRFTAIWGLNSVPAYLIVRRDGRIAREIPGELRREVSIARELNAPSP